MNNNNNMKNNRGNKPRKSNNLDKRSIREYKYVQSMNEYAGVDLTTTYYRANIPKLTTTVTGRLFGEMNGVKWYVATKGISSNTTDMKSVLDAKDFQIDYDPKMFTGRITLVLRNGGILETTPMLGDKLHQRVVEAQAIDLTKKMIAPKRKKLTKTFLTQGTVAPNEVLISMAVMLSGATKFAYMHAEYMSKDICWASTSSAGLGALLQVQLSAKFFGDKNWTPSEKAVRKAIELKSPYPDEAVKASKEVTQGYDNMIHKAMDILEQNTALRKVEVNGVYKLMTLEGVHEYINLNLNSQVIRHKLGSNYSISRGNSDIISYKKDNVNSDEKTFKDSLA